MTETKKETNDDRRKFLKYGAALVAGAVVAGAGVAAYDSMRPAPTMQTQTVTAPPVTFTQTAVQTQSAVAQPASVVAKDWLDSIKSKYAGTTLTMSMAATTSTDALTKMNAEFQQLTGINVVYDTISDVYLQDKQLASPDKYDMLETDFFWIPTYASKEMTVELTPFLEDKTLTPDWFDYNDITPAYRNSCKYQGKVVSMPIAGESRIIVYRKSLFEKYNKEEPKTLDDMYALAEFFQGLKQKDFYGWCGRQNPPLALSGWMEYALFQIGDGFWDPNTYKPTINTPDGVKSLEFFDNMNDQGPPAHASMGWEEAASAFMNGNIAMGSHSSAVCPWIEDPTKSKVVGDVGYMAPPPAPGNGVPFKGHYGAVAGWSLALSAKAPEKNRNATWAYIVWMTSKLNGKKYVLDGGVQTRTSTFTDPDIVSIAPYSSGIKDCLDSAQNLIDAAVAGKTTTWIPQEPLFGDVYGKVTTIAGRAVAHEITAQQACDQSADAITKIFKDAGKL